MAGEAYGSLPFQEQQDFFRRKLNLPTNSWTDIYQHEHDWAFVVAGANRNDILAGFRVAVEKAIAEGGTLEEFRRDFDAIVARHGWDYKGGRNWRSRVIYETNLRSSYQAGRYEQLQELKTSRPYWRYQHSNWVQNPRHQHVQWDGLVIHADDPWWDTHYPPNGWGCQCTVHALSEGDLKQLGKTEPDKAPSVVMQKKLIGVRGENPREVEVPEGIDPGFAYTPGKARLASAIPPERPDGVLASAAHGEGFPNRFATDDFSAPRAYPASRILSSELSPEEYANAFLEEFGATLEKAEPFRDVMGEVLVMGRELFTDKEKGKKNGKLKSHKRNRGPYMKMLADAIKNPDEIWVRLEATKGGKEVAVRRRYLVWYQIEGEDTPSVAVFEAGDKGWVGVTTFPPDVDKLAYMESLRLGIRVYRRP